MSKFARQVYVEHVIKVSANEKLLTKLDIVKHTFGKAVREAKPTNCLSLYLLTPRSKVLLQKITISQLVKKFPAFSGTRKVHYRVHKCPLIVPILSHLNPIHSSQIPLPENPS
jgi:hypothetical protein